MNLTYLGLVKRAFDISYGTGRSDFISEANTTEKHVNLTSCSKQSKGPFSAIKLAHFHDLLPKKYCTLLWQRIELLRKLHVPPRLRLHVLAVGVVPAKYLFQKSLL